MKVVYEKIDDGNTLMPEIKKVKGQRPKPYCPNHGAMNKVSQHEDKGGYWRCVAVAKGHATVNGKRMKIGKDCRYGCKENRLNEIEDEVELKDDL